MTNPFPTIAEHTRSLRASTVLAFATVVLFILDSSSPRFHAGLQLSSGHVPAASISLLTFLFAASSVTDTVLAGVILVYFCRDLEKNLGTGKFLLLYFSCSMAGAGAQYLGASRLPIAGGTAAAIGALVVYAYLWPLNRVTVFGSIP